MAQTNGAVKNDESNMLDKEFVIERAMLTKIMQSSELDPDLRITNLEISHACSAGDNYMSTIDRAFVEGIKSNRKTVQKSFIIKRQLEDLERRKAFVADQVWANEELMYNTVIPRLQRYSPLPLPHPHLFYSDATVMVMEDLGAKGFSMPDRVKGLDLDQTLLVMESLSRFHASSLAMQRLDPADFDSIKNLKHPYSTPGTFGTPNQFVQKSLVDAINVLKETPLQDRYEHVLMYLGKILADQNNYIPFLTEPPTNGLAVLIHGDLWANNIMFSYDAKTKRPNEVKFVDFQGTRIGSIGMDIHHFVYTSIQPIIRREKFELIISFYHSCLVSYLKRFLGKEHDDYIAAFSYQKIYDEFFAYRLCGLLSAICMLPVITCDAAAPAKPKGDPFHGNSQTAKFRERLTDVVEEYMRRDWIIKE